MTVDTEEFFETQQNSSHLKSAIVSAYFGAWANVMKPRESQIGYVELFAGKGRFEDGKESTPVIVARKILADPHLRTKVKTFFNDKDARAIASLQRAIADIHGSECFAHALRFSNQLVTPEITEQLADFCAVPTLLFADPFGYMGISIGLLQGLLCHPKSEAVIFFNTNRINAGVSNDFVREHIDALFGPERAKNVRESVRHLSGESRERTILDSFTEALKSIGFKFVVRLRFLSPDAHRTSHHLIHCSRHPLGEKIMKEIMYPHTVKNLDGVPMYQIPKEDKHGQRSLFDGSIPPLAPLDLAAELVNTFAGKTVQFQELLTRHSPGTVYVERNYRDALTYLVDSGKIACEPNSQFRQGKRIWPKHLRITFPAAS